MIEASTRKQRQGHEVVEKFVHQGTTMNGADAPNVGWDVGRSLPFEIELTQGKVALVDASDHERLASHRWQAICRDGAWYARRGVRRGERVVSVYMHQVIIPEVPEIDHINGDGLDNRRSNLRSVTHQQNLMNKGIHRGRGVKGVSARYGKYRAQIRVGGKLMHLGFFASEEDAARAYNDAAQIHFGEHARLNVGV